MKTRNPLRYVGGLAGSDYFRTPVDVGGSLEEMIAGWRDEPARFRPIRNRYLIYRGR